MVPEWLSFINSIAWIATNIVIVYIGVALLVFTIAYYILFDVKATTAGIFIWRFVLSLVGVMALVIIGVWVDPSTGSSWFQYPGDIVWWRPLVRFLVYVYVGFTITGLAVLLGIRKWKPNKIKIAPLKNLVVPRTDTRDIPVFTQKGEK